MMSTDGPAFEDAPRLTVALPLGARTRVEYMYDNPADVLALAREIGATFNGEARLTTYEARVYEHEGKSGRWIIAVDWGNWSDGHSYHAQAGGTSPLLAGVKAGTVLGEGTP